MSFVWICFCAYLLVSAVGLLEAEIRVEPGTTPSALQVAWAALCYSIAYPISGALRWMGIQAER